MNKQQLLDLRKKKKAKKPNFLRQDWQKKSLKRKWRQPKGIHSKLRRKFAGHIPHPSMGFSSPKEVRFLHPTGFKPIVVTHIEQLNHIQKDEGIILSSTLGLKKKLIIAKKASEMKLNLLNIKSVDEFVKKAEQIKQEKLNAQKLKQEKKQKTQKEAEKVAKKKEVKPKEEKQETPEEKEKRENQEKMKILEGKQ